MTTKKEIVPGRGFRHRGSGPAEALRSKLIDKAKFIVKAKFIYLAPRKALRCPKRCSRVKPVIILELFFLVKDVPSDASGKHIKQESRKK